MNESRKIVPVFLLALGIFAVILAMPVRAADEAEAPKATCPVMDEPVDPTRLVETPDGPLLFCCGKCPSRYKANPEKYAERAAALRKAMAQMPKVQVTCPVSGKTVNREVFSEQGGEKVYFCGPECKSTYEEAPDKYKTKLANSFWYQTKCPITGEDVDPASVVEFSTGQKLYFCCSKCVAKFTEDPEGQMEKLQAMDIYVRAEDIKKGDN